MPDTDDSWAEFYREIGLEPEKADAPAVAETDPEPLADEEPDAEDASAETDEGEEGAEEATGPDGPAGEEELNEDGTKKRRRRRRRRGKKKVGPEGEATGEVDAGAEEVEEPVAEVYDEDGGPTPEASRELIANWDVPSWTEIVAGLHRPSGNDRRG
jgi:hypothetical protein